MPYELYRELSGGLRIVDQIKIHPKAVANDLVILGEYHRSSIGKYIVFYYRSIVRVYGNLPRAAFYKKLRGILAHELRHHNEYLAGCDDLILYDENCIEDYLSRKGK